jgi:hypothetical protein
MQAPERYRPNTSSFAHYWTEGLGVELLNTLGFRPDLRRAEEYVPYLFQQDDAGDRVVDQLHKRIGFAKAQNLLEEYMDHPGNVPREYRGVLDVFFGGFEAVPSWLDMDLLQKGLQLSQRSGIPGLVVLRDYCLMGGYESSAINKALIYTGALKKGAVKRISETVEFWVNVTGDNALQPAGIGFKSVLKTRLIHSFSRINILKASPWDTNKWGTPLNTWDMLATNLGFSLVYLAGLRRFGTSTVAFETEGLFHLWKYIGYLLGIPPALLPDTEKEAIEALYYWTMTQADGDADSRSLAGALQQEPLQAYYPTTSIGRKMMREIHLYYNHYLLGDYSCDLLGLDKTFTGKIAALNIWKNKQENRRIHHESHRMKLIDKGRKQHEYIRELYRRKVKEGDRKITFL